HGVDPKVDGLSSAAFVLWYLGYPEQALQRSREALTLAQGLSHPFNLGLALIMASFLHQLRQERQEAQERAEGAIALSTEQGFVEWLGAGSLLRGWVLAEQGQGEEGIAQMRQSLAAIQANGIELGRATSLAPLAEAYGKAGQAQAG